MRRPACRMGCFLPACIFPLLCCIDHGYRVWRAGPKSLFVRNRWKSRFSRRLREIQKCVRCRQGNDQSWKVVERRKREMFENRRRTEESLCSVCVLAEIYIHKLFFDKRCAVFWDRHEQDRRRLVNKTRSTSSVAGNHGSHSNRKYRDVRGDAKFQHRTSKHCFSLTHSVVCRVGYTVSIRRKVCDSSLQVRDTARRIDSVVRAV